MSETKTAIVTGASRGIGAGLVEAFLKEGYSVVATSHNVSHSLTASRSLAPATEDTRTRSKPSETSRYAKVRW